MNLFTINGIGRVLILLIICFFLTHNNTALSEEPLKKLSSNAPEENKTDFPFISKGKFRLDLTFMGGGGFNNIDVLETTEGDMLTISPGGGVGGKLNLGYCISSSLNVNLELGTQKAILSESCKNADACFKRSHILGTLRYKVPISPKGTINIGSGGGLYMGGKFDFEFQEIVNNLHAIYEYEDAFGFHVLAEYEQFMPNFIFLNANWSWIIGLKYYSVSYELSSIDVNGISIPTYYAHDEMSKVDGSGVDILFSIVAYL